MTIESNPITSRIPTIQNWVPKARRQGEPGAWSNAPMPADTSEPEIVFPSLSTPGVHWPRVFPSL